MESAVSVPLDLTCTISLLKMTPIFRIASSRLLTSRLVSSLERTVHLFIVMLIIPLKVEMLLETWRPATSQPTRIQLSTPTRREMKQLDPIAYFTSMHNLYASLSFVLTSSKNFVMNLRKI